MLDSDSDTVDVGVAESDPETVGVPVIVPLPESAADVDAVTAAVEDRESDAFAVLVPDQESDTVEDCVAETLAETPAVVDTVATALRVGVPLDDAVGVPVVVGDGVAVAEHCMKNVCVPAEDSRAV